LWHCRSFGEPWRYLSRRLSSPQKAKGCPAKECQVIAVSRLRDWVLLLVCNLIWASQFVLVKVVQEQTGPVFATFFPMTLATLLLIPIVRRERLRRAAANESSPLRARAIFEFILIGVFGQVAAQ